MLKNYIKEIKSAFVFSLVVISIFGITGISYSMLSSLSVSNGTTLTSSLWNNLVDHSVPTGAINAFYGTSCPTGWNAADGSGDEVMTDGTLGTLDLRGQFLRGLNDFGTGLRTDGNQNPETKALGDYQADDFKSHNHKFRFVQHSSSPSYDISTNYVGFRDGFSTTTSNGMVLINTSNALINTWYGTWSGKSQILISSQGGDETRPKNVSVIFCIKE